MTTATKLARDTRGASLVEYLVLLGLVAVVAMAGFRVFGAKTTSKIDAMSTRVTTLEGDKPGEFKLMGLDPPPNGTAPSGDSRVVAMSDPPVTGTPTPTNGGNTVPVVTPVPVPAPTPGISDASAQILMARLGLPNGGDRPFVPPKRWDGKPIRGGGFRDADGNVWRPDKSGHGGPHWDVNHPDGSHTNVDEKGKVTHGPDNFPRAPKQNNNNSQIAIDPVPIVVGGGIIATIGAAWWTAKIISPACGPAVLVCAIVF